MAEMTRKPTYEHEIEASPALDDDTVMQSQTQWVPAPSQMPGTSTANTDMRRPPTSPTIELVPGTRLSEYEIEAKIGEGAMGSVYRAVHPAIGKRVAVKIMSPKLCGDPAAIKRFTREARVVAAIRHPGIVDVFGFGTIEDGRAYLIMEWLDGTSLAQLLKHRRFALPDALDVLDQIARALGAAHDKGVIHRDLKPENVFTQLVARERPTVKILDFGLAKLMGDAELRGSAVTHSGQLLGTPLYMSPEQCKGKGVDHRTDIYALGCIAYELICGRPPFMADNVAEVIAAHLSEDPPAPRTLWPEVPAQLDALLMEMLAKDPMQRPAIERIRQIIAEFHGAASPSLTTARVPKIRFTTRGIALAIATVAVGALTYRVSRWAQSSRSIEASHIEVSHDGRLVDAGQPQALKLDAPTVLIMPLDSSKPPEPSKPSPSPPPSQPKHVTPKMHQAATPDIDKSTLNPFKRKQP